jgi:hypothetical protein
MTSKTAQVVCVPYIFKQAFKKLANRRVSRTGCAAGKLIQVLRPALVVVVVAWYYTTRSRGCVPLGVRTTACAFVSSITTGGTARPVHVMTRVLVIRKVVLVILLMKMNEFKYGIND